MTWAILRAADRHMRNPATPDPIHRSSAPTTAPHLSRHTYRARELEGLGLPGALNEANNDNHAGPVALLEPLRFGEYLRERNLINDEQLIAALAAHWSERRFSIGRTLVEQGILSLEQVEAEARAYHHELDVVEVHQD